MSIISEICAEHAEKVRMEWARELAVAIESQDWAAVITVFNKINTPTFSE